MFCIFSQTCRCYAQDITTTPMVRMHLARSWPPTNMPCPPAWPGRCSTCWRLLSHRAMVPLSDASPTTRARWWEWPRLSHLPPWQPQISEERTTSEYGVMRCSRCLTNPYLNCRFNYFLGGFAAGGVFGAWKHNHVAGLCTGLFLGEFLLLPASCINSICVSLTRHCWRHQEDVHWAGLGVLPRHTSEAVRWPEHCLQRLDYHARSPKELDHWEAQRGGEGVKSSFLYLV